MLLTSAYSGGCFFMKRSDFDGIPTKSVDDIVDIIDNNDVDKRNTVTVAKIICVCIISVWWEFRRV